MRLLRSWARHISGARLALALLLALTLLPTMSEPVVPAHGLEPNGQITNIDEGNNRPPVAVGCKGNGAH